METTHWGWRDDPAVKSTAAPAEDPGWVPSSSTAPHSLRTLQPQELQLPDLAPAYCRPAVCIHTQGEHSENKIWTLLKGKGTVIKLVYFYLSFSWKSQSPSQVRWSWSAFWYWHHFGRKWKKNHEFRLRFRDICLQLCFFIRKWKKTHMLSRRLIVKQKNEPIWLIVNKLGLLREEKLLNPQYVFTVVNTHTYTQTNHTTLPVLGMQLHSI